MPFSHSVRETTFDDDKIKGKLVINEAETAVVRDVLYRRAQKQAIYVITKYLIYNNIPSPSGGRWNERTVRMIIELAADLYIPGNCLCL